MNVGVEEGMSGASRKISGEEIGIVYQNETEVKTLSEFMTYAEIAHINLLKMNIEGMEYEIFPTLTDPWLTTNVGNVIAEFHTFLGEELKNRIVGLFPNAGIVLA